MKLTKQSGEKEGVSCASLNNGLTKIFDTNDRFVQKQIIDFEMEKDGEAKMF